MAITLTIPDLAPLDAEALIWLAAALEEKGTRAGVYEDRVIEAFDFFVSLMLDQGYWHAANEYEDITGLAGRLRLTLEAIEK